MIKRDIMPLKNTDEQLNGVKSDMHKSVYFFANRNNFTKKVVDKSSGLLSKHLKSNRPIKYSTVFMLDKVDLKVTDAEIIEAEKPTDYTLTTLEEAKEKVTEQKKYGTKWFNLIFMVVNIIILACVLIYQKNTFGVASLDALLQNARFGILFYTLLLFALIMIIETLRTHILLYKATKQTRLFLCYKASAISRYYDCITPFATGGQPFEIFYMNSRGVHGGIATSIPLTKAMFNNVAFTIISIIILIFNSDLFGKDNQTVIIVWSIISLVISCLILLVLILFAISKKFMPKCLMFFLKLGQKMHLVKNYHLTFNKCMRTILEYQKSTKFYMTNVWVTVSSLLCSGAIVVIRAFIPFMLYWAFSTKVPLDALLEIFSKFILVELATKYIPLPGASGMAEISFSTLFASLFSDGTLFWAMLFWRIMNYFIYLLQGIIVLIYDFAYGNKKNRANLIKLAKREKEIMEATSSQINRKPRKTVKKAE